MSLLLDWFVHSVNVELVTCDFGIYSYHVVDRPCKCGYVMTNEFDELILDVFLARYPHRHIV